MEAFLADAALIEAYRRLRGFLEVPAHPDRTFIVACTAALHGEGASSTAIGLAASLAYDQCGDVLLVDCDFERPCLHERLQSTAPEGLSEILGGTSLLRDAASETLLPRLSVLIRGARRRTGTAAADAVVRWLDAAKGSILPDYVILDLPPVNVDLGAEVLARAADLAVLVVRGGVTPREELRLALLHLEGAAVSVVVNGAERRVPGWLDRLASSLRGTKT